MAPHQGPAVAIIHQPWKHFVKRPVLPVDGRWRLPHDLRNYPSFSGWLSWQPFKRKVQNTSGERRQIIVLTSSNNTELFRLWDKINLIFFRIFKHVWKVKSCVSNPKGIFPFCHFGGSQILLKYCHLQSGWKLCCKITLWKLYLKFVW